MFSQILGVNDHGIAVGYYGDSTTSQHGFIYNSNPPRPEAVALGRPPEGAVYVR